MLAPKTSLGNAWARSKTQPKRAHESFANFLIGRSPHVERRKAPRVAPKAPRLRRHRSPRQEYSIVLYLHISCLRVVVYKKLLRLSKTGGRAATDSAGAGGRRRTPGCGCATFFSARAGGRASGCRRRYLRGSGINPLVSNLTSAPAFERSSAQAFKHSSALAQMFKSCQAVCRWSPQALERWNAAVLGFPALDPQLGRKHKY